MTTDIILTLDQKTYRITPNIAMILDIEAEMGSLKKLEQRFLKAKWSVTDLITLTHILLSTQDDQIDFMTLGDRMMREGFQKHHTIATQFLSRLMI